MTVFIDVPFNSKGHDRGVALGPAAIGLGSRTVAIRDATEERGPFGFRSEDSLVAMVDDVERAVRETWATGDLPVLIGGDCPVMLGAVRAVAGGLVFVDGHEDAWPPLPEESGEAADSELGIALGIVESPLRAELDADHVVVLGPRDGVELEFAGIPRVGDLVTFRDADWLALVDDDELDATLGPVGDQWWFHVDLDVLSTDALAAVDYPQPGGIHWARLEHVTQVILSRPGCRGASIVIYNPELDSGAAAPRIAEYGRMVASLLDRERRVIH